MAVQVSYPGVYIEEFTPGAPIQPVGVGTGALLGPAAQGPIMQPVQITSWDAFKAQFGDAMDGYYLWYAVRGFFENGGQVLYVVRVSNARKARLVLNDRNAAPTLDVEAVKPGLAGDGIQVKVAVSHALNPANSHAFTFAAEHILSVAGTIITLDSGDAALNFRPGDLVTVDEDTSQRGQVLSISGANVTVAPALTTALNGRHLRLADVSNGSGDRVLRLSVSPPDNPANLGPGSVLELTQGGVSHPTTVASVMRETVTFSNNATQATYRVTFKDPLPDLLIEQAITVQSVEFDLTVANPNESYPFLSMNPVSTNYWGTRVNAVSPTIQLSAHVPPSGSAAPLNQPDDLALTNLANGLNENLATLAPGDFADALALLVDHKDINFVAIPDRQDAGVQQALLAHCQGAPPRAGDRMAIFDSQLGVPTSGPGSIVEQRGGLDSFLGFGALYYPWIRVTPAPPPASSPPPPVAPPPILVPPSGHVAGIWARIATGRGVHKAPAGEEAVVQGALGVERVIGDVDQGLLNVPYGINVIRLFKPRGQPIVWGARTTASGVNSSWQYINIRRLFLFLEASISEGVRGSTFEPNNLELWGKLRRTITAFLTQVWRDGALFGATAKDAFYVRIDQVLNPPDQLALGRLTIEIGVRPSYPAEFIVVRIGIWEGGAQVSEQ